MSYDVLTMGRVGVDIYPLQTGVGLEDVETFGKFLGGSATNVAVAAARHGRTSAVITRTGADPFGRFVHRALGEFGVDDAFVTAVPELPTPVTFCEIFPPDDFPIWFYRYPKAPDLEIKPEEIPMAEIQNGPAVLGHGDRAVRRAEPRRASRGLAGPRPGAADRARPGLPAGVLGLAGAGPRAGPGRAPPRHRGRRQPGRGGHRGRHAGRAGRGRGAAGGGRGTRGGQAGPGGRVRADAGRGGARSRRSGSRWSTGSALATGSAARCATGCWPGGRWSGSSPSPTRPGRSSPPGWSAPRRCRRPKRSRTSCGGRMGEEAFAAAADAACALVHDVTVRP